MEFSLLSCHFKMNRNSNFLFRFNSSQIKNNFLRYVDKRMKTTKLLSKDFTKKYTPTTNEPIKIHWF